MTPAGRPYVKAKPKVQAYMEEHRASVRAGLVNHEVEFLAKFNISREQILAKWWEFGNLDPSLGYNTSSQSKALELLWKGLGYADADAKKPGEGEGDKAQEPQIYVAKWLREARGQDPRDPNDEEWPCTDSEPVMGHPETSPATPSPAVAPPSLTMSPSRDTGTRSVEPTRPYRWAPGAGFGRFQGR